MRFTPDKMTTTLRSSVLAALLMVAVFSTGCKKVVHQNIQAASNSSVAIMAYNDVFKQLHAAMSFGMELDQSPASWTIPGGLCATATLLPTGAAFPKTLTIDFGSGCIGPDGISRSGQIKATFQNNFSAEGSTAEVLFVNYTTGQYALSGTYTVTRNGATQFSENVADAVIAWGTREVRWEAELTRSWTAGDTTDFTTFGNMDGLNDDLFELTGTAEGNDSNTHPFSLEILTGLVLPADCQYITEGTLSIYPTNFNEGTVDYGSGECDIQSTIEVDGEVFNFTL